LRALMKGLGKMGAGNEVDREEHGELDELAGNASPHPLVAGNAGVAIFWNGGRDGEEGGGVHGRGSGERPLFRVATAMALMSINGFGSRWSGRRRWRNLVKYAPIQRERQPPFPFSFLLDATMTAQIIDGKALAEELRQGFKARVEALTAKGHKPGLVVILVGADPASEVYVRNKVNGCLAIGMHSEKITYDATIDQATVLNKIAELNADPNIHGILVQLPLPKHFDEEAVLEAIAADKDVDGFHAENVGALAQGNPRFIPCTPYGVMKMFEKGNVDLSGKEAVVIGRSNIVGKPMALLLINAGATVTVCNSRTKDLLGHTRRADILVAAVGKPKFVTADMVKPGAVVIDVGINRLPDGKLCGDVDFAGCLEVAGQITPVPGGVGPMTITMLLANTIEAAERKAAAA